MKSNDKHSDARDNFVLLQVAEPSLVTKIKRDDSTQRNASVRRYDDEPIGYDYSTIENKCYVVNGHSEPIKRITKLLQSVREKGKQSAKYNNLEKWSPETLKSNRNKSRFTGLYTQIEDNVQPKNAKTKTTANSSNTSRIEDIKMKGEEYISELKKTIDVHSRKSASLHDKKSTDFYLKQIISKINTTGAEVPDILKDYIKKHSKIEYCKVSKKRGDRRQSLPTIRTIITPKTKQSCINFSNSVQRFLIDKKRFTISKINRFTKDNIQCDMDFYISQMNKAESTNLKKFLPSIFMHNQQLLASTHLLYKSEVCSPDYFKKDDFLGLSSENKKKLANFEANLENIKKAL
jgi:hypothetical protein